MSDRPSPQLPPFQDDRLLQRAFYHRSYVNEAAQPVESNERLEFLGDAVLNFVSGAFLYREKPEFSEATLTRLRSRLVDEPNLAEFARQFQLGERLQLGRGEMLGGGRNKDSLLSDCFEAVVGAYFLDSGIEAVQQWIEPLLAATIARWDTPDDRGDRLTDAKTRFQECVQKRLGKQGIVPKYRTVAESGMPHDLTFTVEVWVGDRRYGRGSGSRKREAEQQAARAALQQWERET